MGEAFKKSEKDKVSLAERVKFKESIKTYDLYVNELKLSHEDLSKRILDVGADFGLFAVIAKQKGYNDIYSIDIGHPADDYNIDTEITFGAGKMAVADAFKLPFKDGSFDLAISFCAMPNVVEGENPIDYGKEVKKVFKEMLRVVKVGGEIRLGRVVSEYQRGDLQKMGEQVRNVLRWFDKKPRRFQTSIEVTGKINRDPSYLVRIKKLS